MAGPFKLKVMNPVSPQAGEVKGAPYAARPASLEGKTIGLMWSGKAHGDDALRKAGELIQEQIPSATIKFYSGSLPFPDDLRNEAISEVDVAIGCTAD